MFSFSSVQRLSFEILLVGIFIFDLGVQGHYLNGPLFSTPPITSWAPWIALLLGVTCFAWRRVRRPGIALIALLHYSVTKPPTSEADAWIWLMALALVCIPDGGDHTESYWVGVLKLTGFLVYLYAGLNKAIHREWWTGEALTTVLQVPFLTKEPFSAITQWPKVCQILCRLTLIQRLIVPWGLWSKRLWVRRLSAGILVGMHGSYALSLNLGIFSWVGFLYLMPFFFPCRKQESEYYRGPPHTGWWSACGAAAVAIYLVIIPGWAFATEFGFPRSRVKDALIPRGFILSWTMFANPVDHSPFSTYRVRTCAGEELSDDRIYWRFGSSSDYFRRRLWTRILTFQLGDVALSQGSDTFGPLEQQLITNFPKRIAGRQWQIFTVTPAGPKLLMDSGYTQISDCGAGSLRDKFHGDRDHTGLAGEAGSS